MKVTIIGTGNMARGIGTRALAGGHAVALVGTETGKAESLVTESNIRHLRYRRSVHNPWGLINNDGTPRLGGWKR